MYGGCRRSGLESRSLLGAKRGCRNCILPIWSPAWWIWGCRNCILPIGLLCGGYSVDAAFPDTTQLHLSKNRRLVAKLFLRRMQRPRQAPEADCGCNLNLYSPGPCGGGSVLRAGKRGQSYGYPVYADMSSERKGFICYVPCCVTLQTLENIEFDVC